MPDRNPVAKQEFIAELCLAQPHGQCVDWPWSVDGRGYAQVWDGVGVRKVSHLVLLGVGETRPPGASALHACDRPRCVAPWHLRWGNQSENQYERWQRTGKSRACSVI